MISACGKKPITENHVTKNELAVTDEYGGRVVYKTGNESDRVDAVHQKITTNNEILAYTFPK